MTSEADKLVRKIVTLYKRGTISFTDYERSRAFLQDFDFIPNPQDPVTWKEIGNIFFKEEDYDTALECYENALKIDHYNVDALNNTAMTYKILGNDEDAKEIFEYIKVIEQKKNERSENTLSDT